MKKNISERVAKDVAYLSELDRLYGITQSLRYPRPPNVRRTKECKKYWGIR